MPVSVVVDWPSFISNSTFKAHSAQTKIKEEIKNKEEPLSRSDQPGLHNPLFWLVLID